MGLLKALSGYKTYLGMIALGVIGILASLGKISAETAGVAGSIVATYTGVAARAAVQKAENAAKNNGQ